MMRIVHREASWLVAFAIFICVSISVTIVSPYYLTLLITVGLTAISASGLRLLLSCGQVSLGHAAYVGVGAYTAALLSRNLGVSPLLALLFGILGAAALALIVGGVTLRLKGHFLALATLAIGVAVPATIVAASGLTGGASGLREIPPLSIGPWLIADQRIYAILVWSAALIVVGGFGRLGQSRIGRAIAAVRTSGDLSSMCGIEAARLKITVFVISGAVAGLSGALYVFFYRYVSPAPFDLSASINLLIVCVVGGSGNAFGALLGAIAMTAIQVVLQDFFARGLGLPGQVETLAFGVIMVVILMKWPAGLWALLEAKWPRLVPERGPSTVALKQGGTMQNSDAVVRISNVTKSFEGLRALGGVSFEIRSNEILGLIGPNGAGKSTLFNIITGLLLPTSGAVTLGGKSLPRPSRLAAHGVTRTFQHVKLVPELSVLENVALGSFYRGRAGFVGGMFGLDAGEEAVTFRNAWRVLEIVGLDEVAVLPAARLAMGQARMLEIARAIIGQPRLLLLDEPAAGLRTGEKLHLVTILHRLKRQGTSIMIVEHDMDLVMNSVDRVVVLDRGEGLASGSPATVREDPRVIAAYLGA